LGADSVSVLLNDGSGYFTLAGPDISIVGGPVEGQTPTRIALVDVDNDGDLDILTANAGDLLSPTPVPSISLLLNNGAGHFDMATNAVFPLVEKSFPFALSHRAMAVAVVDVNGDTEPDLVMATLVSATAPEESHVTVLLSNP